MTVPKRQGDFNLIAQVAKHRPSCILAIDRYLNDHISGDVTRVYYSRIFGDQLTAINLFVRKAIIAELVEIYSNLDWTVVINEDLKEPTDFYLAFS